MRPLYRYVLVLVAILMLAGATAARSDTFSYQTLDYPGAQSTYAYKINNGGQIVGTYYDGAWHGFLLSGGVYTNIDKAGAQNTDAFGINDAGKIVGTYYDGAWHGFLLSGGVYTTIEPSGSVSSPGQEASTAYDINSAGQIVGYYYNGAMHGYLFDGQTYTSLDISGAVATETLGIDDNGRFVGAYQDSLGNWHGYASVPLPPSLLLLGSGLLGLVGWRRFRKG